MRRSTLLKAIGKGLVVGFPRNLRALYVDQLEVAEKHRTVLEVVMSADKDVLTWRRQAQQLQVFPDCPSLAIKCSEVAQCSVFRHSPSYHFHFPGSTSNTISFCTSHVFAT